MPSFTYTRNIPAANNDPSNDQPNMNVNTNSIDSIFAVDHYSFNNANGGWHKQCTFVDQTIPTVASGQCAIYGKDVGGTSNLFFTDRTTTNEYQLTRADNSLYSLFATATVYSPGFNGGWTYLPGGILLQYGYFTTTDTSLTVPFPKNFTNTPFTVHVNNSTNSIRLDAHTFANNQFEFSASSGGSKTATWMAIGV